MLRYLLVWLRGFHRGREKAKATDWAMVILTFLATVAAFVSAWLFQAQLTEARRTFRLDERAWLELEPTQPQSSPAKLGAVPEYKYEILVKNVGKTAARSVTLKLAAANLLAFSSDKEEIECLERLQKILRMPDEKSAVPPKSNVEHCSSEFTTETIAANVPQLIAPNTTITLPMTGGSDSFINTGGSSTSFGLVPRRGVELLRPFIPWGIIQGLPARVLLGRLEYRDVFDIAHWRTICISPTERGQTFGFCDAGNAEDENLE